VPGEPAKPRATFTGPRTQAPKASATGRVLTAKPRRLADLSAKTNDDETLPPPALEPFDSEAGTVIDRKAPDLKRR